MISLSCFILSSFPFFSFFSFPFFFCFLLYPLLRCPPYSIFLGFVFSVVGWVLCLDVAWFGFSFFFSSIGRALFFVSLVFGVIFWFYFSGWFSGGDWFLRWFVRVLCFLLLFWGFLFPFSACSNFALFRFLDFVVHVLVVRFVRWFYCSLNRGLLFPPLSFFFLSFGVVFVGVSWGGFFFYRNFGPVVLPALALFGVEFLDGMFLYFFCPPPPLNILGSEEQIFFLWIGEKLPINYVQNWTARVPRVR